MRSPAGDDGGAIPRRYGYTEGTASLAIVEDDPDAVEPAGKVWDHWVLRNVQPDRPSVPADYDPAGEGAREGDNDYGERGDGCPDPPDGVHPCEFTTYALDAEVDLRAGASKAELLDVIESWDLDQVTLTGTYEP